MTKQEFLAASLPYDLILLGNNGDEEYTAVLGGIQGDRYYDESGNEIEDFKPIIRPIASLTKECVQSDYNGGKPFIPIVELAKLGLSKIDSKVYTFDRWYNEGYFYIAECIGSKRLVFDGNSFWYQNGWGSITIPQNQLQLFQQLLKWHFYPDMPENEEVIYITDEFNPYK